MEKACEAIDRERLAYQLALVKLLDKADKLVQQLELGASTLPDQAKKAWRELRTESFSAHRTLGSYYELLGE